MRQYDPETSRRPGRARAAALRRLRCHVQRHPEARVPAPVPATTSRRPRRTRRTPTGRRVAFTRAGCRPTSTGRSIDPTEWNRNDGFSPGQPIIVHVPSLKTQAEFDKLGDRPGQRPRASTGPASSRCCCSTRRPASARSSGASSTPTPTTDAAAQPDHPPGEEPRAGRTLRGRPARPEGQGARGPVGHDAGVRKALRKAPASSARASTWPGTSRSRATSR